MLASWPISECYDYPVISASNHKCSSFWRYTTKWEQLIARSPSWQKIFSKVVSFSILSLFIYKFGDYQNIVSNKSNDKRRNLGWNHSVTKSELNQKTMLHSKIYCLQQKPVLQRLLELLIDTVVSKCIHNLCAFRGINFIPRLVFQVESVEDYLF